MSDTTTNLQLSYLAPGQAQKHVTVNESLRLLDAVVQLAVVSATTTAEPGSPADGAVYIVPSGKTGTHWAGFTNWSLGYYRDGAWVQISPREGWLAWVKDTDRYVYYTGSAWSDLPAGSAAAGAWAFQGVISPTQITANTNDYAPTGLSGASVLRLSTDASRNLTGLTGGASGRLMVIENTGANNLVVKNADTGSSAANRFAIGADLTLGADQGVALLYDATSSRWRVFGGAGSGGGGLSGATDAQTRDRTSSSVAVTPANLAGRARFSAHKNNTSQTGIASSTFTKLTFTTEDEDVGSYYDAANSKWVPPAGPVRISAACYMSSDVVSGTQCVIAIYKNGSAFKNGFNTVAFTNNGGANVSCLDTANGTDYYEVYVFVVASGTGTCNGSTAYSYFQGEQV